MKLYVREFRPREWFLLGDLERDGDYYLDVNCNVGPFGFSALVKLSEPELEEYRGVGRVYVESLVAKIRSDVEGQRAEAAFSLPSSGPHRYAERDLSGVLAAEVTDAVVKFKQTRPDVSG